MAHLFAFFLLTDVRVQMILLLYVNAEELVLPFRVAGPFGFKRVGVLGFTPSVQFLAPRVSIQLPLCVYATRL